MHCVGQFTWCWSLWEKGDHPSHYFISSLTLSHRCTLAHTPRARTQNVHAHTHTQTSLFVSACPSLSPSVLWACFVMVVVSNCCCLSKKKNSKLCRVVQTVTSREGFFILNTTVVYFKNATASGFGMSHGRVWSQRIEVNVGNLMLSFVFF